MKTVTTTRRQMQWLAGTVAALAAFGTMGGTLSLAEHYAQTGASRQPSGYYAAEQARRLRCPDKASVRAAVASPRRGAENS